MDRRTFVKGCVALAGSSALAAGGLAFATGATETRAPSSLVRYFGARRVGGPAPRGIPYLPLTLQDGAFAVDPTPFRWRGVTYEPLTWLRYCGHGGAPGARADAALDNVLRYHFPADLGTFLTPWYARIVGQPVRPEHFPDVGYGARFTFRTPAGAQGPDVLQGIILRADAIRRVAPSERGVQALSAEEHDLLQRRVFHGEFVAAFAACTHFCATLGYKEAEAIARSRNAWDDAFCSSHLSAFDLRQPVAYQFEPEGRAVAAPAFDPLRA